jgi:CheY-like chemotaxis protein
MTDKILVVDDDLDTLRLVGLMLEKQGYKITAATTGQQALTLAKNEKPILILLDLMMPDISGIEVAKRLRADPDTHNILIIMFTAKGQMEDKLEGFDAGADAYLVKPIQPRELVANVKAVLQRAGAPAGAGGREYKVRGDVIGLIAAKGGVGVTTLAVNLGLTLLTQAKKPVIVSDFRPGAGALGLEMGIRNAFGMTQLLELTPSAITPETVERELTEHYSGVRFLYSSSRAVDAKYSSVSDNFGAIANSLAYLARFVILDLGVGLTPVNTRVLESCQQVILVIEPVAQSITISRGVYDYLIEKGIREDQITLALVNRMRAGMQLSLGQAQDELGRTVNVVFTAAPELAYQAQISCQPMVLRQNDGVTVQQFNSLSQKVIQAARA